MRGFQTSARSVLVAAAMFAAAAPIAAVGAIAPAAASAAATLSLTYTCTYPLVGDTTLRVGIDHTIPASAQIGVPTPEATISVAIAGPDRYEVWELVGATKIEGSARLGTTITYPGGVSLPVAVPITFASSPIPPSKLDVLAAGSGTFPSVTYPSVGTAKIRLDSIALQLRAVRADGKVVRFPGAGADSDGNPETFDVSCRLDPVTQSTQLATVAVISGPVPTTPVVTTPKPTTPVPTTPKPTTPVPPTTPKPTTPGDTVAPVVTIGAVTQTPTQTGSSVRVGFSLSEGAKVTATFSQLRPGVILGGTCILVPGGVVVTPANACLKRVYQKPSPTAWFNKDAREIVFAQAPKPAGYDLTLEAVDAAGNRSFVTRAVTLS